MKKFLFIIFPFFLFNFIYGAPIEVNFNNDITKDYLYLENDFLKITIAKAGGKIIEWYVKEPYNKDIALFDPDRWGVLAQRLTIFDNPDNYWPEGWPTIIGTEDYETEIVTKNKNRARIKQTFIVLDTSIFSGLTIEKYYTFWKNKYHLDVEYVIKNISDETVSYYEGNQEYGINLTVETAVNVGANYIIAFKSKGKITSFVPASGSNPEFRQKTQWCAVADNDSNYVMGSKYSAGLTSGLWPGEERPGGRDYEIIFRSVVYEPGHIETYHFTIYGGPGSIENFEQLKLQKGLVSKSNFNTPKIFQLEQNYPNPFNPSTNILYSIPNSDFVTLKVYDMLGSEIQTLVSEFQKAATYSVNFDASKLSSGMYFYKLQVGSDFVETKKMLLIR